jgi:hypothetical protein
MDLQVLRDFEQEVGKLVPGFRVAFKDESKTQKLIGLIAKPFNPEYMTRYTSTFYPVVWFPTRAYYEGQPRSSLTVLAHELVHLIDTQRHPFWFRVSYLFPQVLSLAAFATYVALCGWRAWPLLVLLVGLLLGALLARVSMGAFVAMLILALGSAATCAVLFGGWASVPFFVGLALFAPWPAPWRVDWEVRGYGMSLAVVQWTYSGVIGIVRESTINNFVRSSYYFMSWRRKPIETDLDSYIERARTGTLREEVPYKQVYDFLAKNGLV